MAGAMEIAMEIMDPMPAVLAVVAVVGGVWWWLGRKGAIRFRRASFRRPARRLESIERLALGPQHALHLVRLDDRAFLVTQSPGGLTVVDGGPSGTSENGVRARTAAEHG